MKILKREILFGFKSFLICTITFSFLLAVCVFIFPDMKSQLENLSGIMGKMGGFAKAFNLNDSSFASFIGYYGLETSNMLGIGVSIYASYLGINIILKEETLGTAEFLYTHPLSRKNIILQKFMAMIIQIVLMNILIMVISLISIVIIGEKIDFKIFMLVHIAHIILHMQFGIISFALAMIFKRVTVGMGIGFVMIMYFINIISNIQRDIKIYKYLTPFSYTDVSNILISSKLQMKFILIGFAVSTLLFLVGYFRYIKKDFN